MSLTQIALDRLAGIGDAGLSAAAVETRRAQFGANDIIEQVAANRWQPLLDTLRDPMLWFLLFTSTLFVFVGDIVGAVVLLVAIVPLAGMDLFLHRRTHASLAGLGSRLASTAVAIRDGQRCTIPAREVVPGDHLEVTAGEAFPADGVVIGGSELQVDEGALTGEALPVTKRLLRVAELPAGTPAVDEIHCVFAGSRLLTGTALVQISATGGETRYGAIVRSAQAGSQGRTPLQTAIASLVGVLLATATLLCVVLAWVRWNQGHGLVDALISAVILAVAALPEEFPIVMTFFLGVGVYRLAARQALVRRAVVVENIGRVSVICSDKTGTITEGRLVLAHLLPAAGVTAEELLRIAAAASRRETGDPVDLAILAHGGAALPWEPLACFPFTEDRKRETGIWRQDGSLLAAVKGAPEIVLGSCPQAAADTAAWQARITQLAGQGHKVIACASRILDAGLWPGGEPDRGFHFAGLLAFEDPVRAGVTTAIGDCRAAGIRVMMLTGDHPATALAVAREIGLHGAASRLVTGAELEALLEHDGGDALRNVDIVARSTPAQKLAVVCALKNDGATVAVTGDGVNDVPALQAADIGIAMGGRGTRSAREAAAIVLLDDNFASIVGAIAEGRQLFVNLQRSFQYLLMVHLPLVFTATFIPLAGYPLLYLPVHVVWLELIIHPTAMLAFQNMPHKLKPTARSHPDSGVIFNRREWVGVVVVGSAIALMVTLAYLFSLGLDDDVGHARAMAMATLCAASAALTAGLGGLRNRMARVLVGAGLVIPVALIQTPRLNGWLNLAPLHGNDWLLATACGGVTLLLVVATTPRGPAQRLS